MRGDRWTSGTTVATLAALTLGAVVAGGGAAAGQALADPCAGAPRAPFVDVGDNHVHATPIDCLYGLDVLRGQAVDRFVPDVALRRDQMATLVAGAIRAAGGQLPPGPRGVFDDVTGGAHRDAIEALAGIGVVEGRAPGIYDPAAIVSRGQMTAFLVRAHDHLLGSGGAPPAPDAFVDDDGHPHEATINRAAQLGLASGRTATRFAPNDPTRRDQAATFVERLLRAAATEGTMTPPTWGQRSRVSALPDSLRATMTGMTWRPGCPVGLDDLRLVETVYRGFDGRNRTGLLVLHRSHATNVVNALAEAYAGGLRIERMELIERYGGNDTASMDANNSSAFNCRRVSGSTSWSEHAYGRAIDLNPIQNPYVRGSVVAPSAGRAYLDRTRVRTGMVVEGDATVRAFDRIGWGWGGRWSSLRDYQHFSSTGR